MTRQYFTLTVSVRPAGASLMNTSIKVYPNENPIAAALAKGNRE